MKATGEVKTVYRCICDKNLEMFKAEEHLKRIKDDLGCKFTEERENGRLGALAAKYHSL